MVCLELGDWAICPMIGILGTQGTTQEGGGSVVKSSGVKVLERSTDFKDFAIFVAKGHALAEKASASHPCFY